MEIPAHFRRTLALGASVVSLVACSGRGAARNQTATAASPPSQAVARLQVVETPDRIIYTAPVSLAKPPDTTSHARKRPT